MMPIPDVFEQRKALLDGQVHLLVKQVKPPFELVQGLLKTGTRIHCETPDPRSAGIPGY